MIRPFRQRHRATFAVLAIALPTLFIAGLAARTDPAVQDTIPESLLGERDTFEGDWNHPDPLLYWSEHSAGVGDALPADARLLGTIREGALVSSIEAPSGGHLLVYSLAKQEVVDQIGANEGERP